MADFANCLPTLKKINFLFYGTFGQLTAKRVTYPLPENLKSWTTFSPGSKIGRHVSLSTTLPRLCSKCRGSKSAAKLPDPFPQRSCLGAIWHRYNFRENRGEICIPSIRDAQAPGEIYLCQLCGDVTFHSTNQKNPGKLGMKQIFQDLLAEIVQLYYAEHGTRNSAFSKIPVRPRRTSVSSVDSNKSEKKNGGWVLMIGNVRDSTYEPKIIQSFLPKSEKIRSSPNSTDDPGLTFPSVPNLIKTDISGFECSPDIWSKKALERTKGRKQLPSLMTLRVPPGFELSLNFPKPKVPLVPTVANSRPMLEEQAASLINDEDFLLEQQQTLSRECAESVLTSNDLTENFLMSEEELEELLPLDLTSAHGDDKENNNNFNVDLFQVNNFEPKNQINSDLNLTQQNTNPNFESQIQMVSPFRRPYGITDPMYNITFCMTMFISFLCTLLTVWC